MTEANMNHTHDIIPTSGLVIFQSDISFNFSSIVRIIVSKLVSFTECVVYLSSKALFWGVLYIYSNISTLKSNLQALIQLM